MKVLQQREKEIKRARGEISCAECRRLKLRCDRKLPCSTCVRRGCEDICPNGTLLAGQEKKPALDDTEELRLKIVNMSDRIRDLEDALEVAHPRDTKGPHPLLCNDLKAIKFVVGLNVESENDIPRHIHDPLESFGALKISDDGESRFLGPSAGSEGILLNELAHVRSEDDSGSQIEIPPKLYELAQMWPFTPIDLPKDDIRIIIEAQLPTLDRATALCNAYIEHVSWYCMPVSQQQLFRELLAATYGQMSSDNRQAEDTHQTFRKLDNHDLALLLVVFACGAACEQYREPKHGDGQQYYRLSRVALGLQPIFARSSLTTVQVLLLMALYDIVSMRKNNLEETWKVVFMAANIAGSIGLHRDPGRWKLEPKVMERRRNVFWELYLLCNWQCLASGRSPPFVRSSVDVHLPQDVDMTIFRGKTIPGYRTWKFQFLDECIAPVTDRLCADSTPLKYYELVNFDKKIRDFDDIEFLPGNAASLTSDNGNVPLSLRNKMLCYKSSLLLYLHRNFFAKAISESPDNPRRPPYGISFMAAFSNAVSILEVMHQERAVISPWITRFWSIIAHALECGFVVGSVAARCPRTSFATPAYQSLEFAIELFRDNNHPVTKIGLPVLLRLREKAQQAIHSSHIVPSNVSSTPVNTGSSEKDAADELSILRGASRVIIQSSDKQDVEATSGSSHTTPGSTLSSDATSEQALYGQLPSATHGELLKQVPSTAFVPVQDQTASDPFLEANSFSWQDFFDQPGDQSLFSGDFAMGDAFVGQPSSTLPPDVPIELPELWTYIGTNTPP
ncbi:uncharacterized protein FOMMEDRAFT_119797 [Fomitiporia mediterranea MF3/22]|uniref:uncharacterized protein n=1 Tax=Fomitiporia mediterranea (strain MF3/22) TaxID=694068 RepID=UPI0004409C0B|nr:uncharacterized protein FOMMEDRAFT_119797 [Fomitiporia mediterranea MF3/22]EJD06233.1 hypothetical protein FOMMEDRAFT_119797 [Fomitiporia mediterranea MF3/22]